MSNRQLALTVPAVLEQKAPSSPVLNHSHRSALNHLGRAFTGGQPLAILIGEGKSGACYVIGRFLAAIEGDVAVVRITEPCSNVEAGMREVIHAIGFESTDMNLTDLENVFTMFLTNQRSHHRRTIICMEETQDYGRWVLNMVRRLVELETKDKFGLMVILSGQPSLNELLNDPILDPIRAQAEQRIALERFMLAETRDYIRWRIESTGTTDIAQVFEFDAITVMHELSNGVADTVSDLCSKCLQLADEENMVPVTTNLVRKAEKLLRQPSATQQPDTEAGLSEVNGVSPQRGRLIARMNGELVQDQPLNGGHILIGRDKLCDVHIACRTVSRHHALVANFSNGARILDLGSTNGTFVDGRKIKEHALQDSGVLAVGGCRIKYVAADDRQGWFFDIEPTDDIEPPNAVYGTQLLRTWRHGNGKTKADHDGAPGGRNIKGNINSKGERIYHAPGSSVYGATKIDETKGERWFCSEAEAEAEGWRAPRG